MVGEDGAMLKRGGAYIGREGMPSPTGGLRRHEKVIPTESGFCVAFKPGSRRGVPASGGLPT